MDHNPEYRTGLLIAHRPNLLGDHPLSLHRHPAPQLFQDFRRWMPIDERLIFLFQLVAGMGDAKGDVTIIREQQQAGGLPIESANRHDPFRDFDEVHDRPPSPLIARRRDVSGRLIQQNIAPLLGPQWFAIDRDLLTRGIDLCPQFTDYAPVDRNPAFQDQLLRLAAGRHAMSGQDSLKPFHVLLLPKMSEPLPRSSHYALMVSEETQDEPGIRAVPQPSP